LRIVMLGPFGLHPKGTMRARALPAARALAARGHAVDIVMPPWHTPAEAGRTWVDPTGVYLEYVSLAGLGVPGLGHAAVAARMARRALAARADVVHVFKPKAYGALAAMLLRIAQRRGARLALVVDTDDWEGAGGWNALEPYSGAMRAVFARQERWGLVHCDAVTVASRALEALVWSLGVPPARVTYLPNALGDLPPPPGSPRAGAEAGGSTPGAVTPAPVRPAAEAGGRTSAPTLLLYTRFFEFDLARPLEVLARVRAACPGTRLVVAGRGLFGEETRFLEAARARGLGEAVEYRGWLEADAAAATFASADVALYPFDDTLVNRTKSAVKLLELLAAGVPVVAEAVGENREVIADGRSGRLVPAGDVDAFAAAVIDLLASPERARALGAAGRACVADSYRWSGRVTTLEGAYAAAAAGR
jgi:glycosyltransferase involved in cell wall biosynthesis